MAPPAPGVDVTITVADPSVALISTDPTAPGSGSVTFPLVTGTSTPLIYVQGLTLNQGTELRITAPGYDQWITTVQVVDVRVLHLAARPVTSRRRSTPPTGPSGSVRLPSTPCSGPTRTNRCGVGGTYSVDVLSSNTSVGVITISPLVFTGTEDYLNTAFDPIAVGTTTISISQPPGFTPPAGETSIVATVNPA